MIVLKHLAVAAYLSFGPSLLFWIGWGVFDMRGFWLVNEACAIAGALAGYFPAHALS